MTCGISRFPGFLCVCPGRNIASRGANRGSLGLMVVIAPMSPIDLDAQAIADQPERQHHLCPAPRGRLHMGGNPAPSPDRSPVSGLSQGLLRRTPTPVAAGMGDRGRPRVRLRRRPHRVRRALRLGPATSMASAALRCLCPPRRPHPGDQHPPPQRPHPERHPMDSRHARPEPRARPPRVRQGP